MATETGRELILVLVSAESARVLRELGRLADALAAAEEAVDRARLAGSPQQLLWAQTGLASAHAGDRRRGRRPARGRGRARARRAAEPPHRRRARLVPGRRPVAAGNPERAVPALLEAFGGPALPDVIPADRPAAAADLVDAQLAAGDLAGARDARTRRAGRPHAVRRRADRPRARRRSCSPRGGRTMPRPRRAPRRRTRATPQFMRRSRPRSPGSSRAARWRPPATAPPRARR